MIRVTTNRNQVFKNTNENFLLFPTLVGCANPNSLYSDNSYKKFLTFESLNSFDFVKNFLHFLNFMFYVSKICLNSPIFFEYFRFFFSIFKNLWDSSLHSFKDPSIFKFSKYFRLPQILIFWIFWILPIFRIFQIFMFLKPQILYILLIFFLYLSDFLDCFDFPFLWLL